jgi:hypothetical protein
LEGSLGGEKREILKNKIKRTEQKLLRAVEIKGVR